MNPNLKSLTLEGMGLDLGNILFFVIFLDFVLIPFPKSLVVSLTHWNHFIICYSKRTCWLTKSWPTWLWSNPGRSAAVFYQDFLFYTFSNWLKRINLCCSKCTWWPDSWPSKQADRLDPLWSRPGCSAVDQPFYQARPRKN